MALFFLLAASTNLQAQIFVDSTGSNGFGDLPHPLAKSRFSNTDHEYNLFVRTTGVDTVRGVGIYNYLNDGTAEKYGIWNHIEQASGADGLTFGLRNVVSHGGDADAYGLYNDLSKTENSKGRLFGNYSLIDDQGAKAFRKMFANFYGETVHRSRNNAYGSYLLVRSKVSGDNKASYGQYVNIRGNGTAERYGIYSNINGGNGYAGYFVGDVHINGTFTQAADERLKKNVRKIDGALDIIQSLKPRTYSYKESEAMGFGEDDALHYGFLAQEVAKVLPDLVTDVHHTYTEQEESVGLSEFADTLGIPSIAGADAGARLGGAEAVLGAADIRGVRYLDMIALLVGAVQEQEKVISKQQRQFDALIADSEDLRNELTRIKETLVEVQACAPCTDALPAHKSKTSGAIRPINIYPNPATDHITIERLEGKQPLLIRVMDANGRLIREVRSTEKQTELVTATWPTGTYIVEILGSKSRDLLKTKRITVQR